jgi:hypothetical protein
VSIFNNSATDAITIEGSPAASHVAVPSLGINTITSLEYSSIAGGGAWTSTFYGTEAHMILTARWMA